MLNNEFVQTQAAELAKRLLREAPSDERGRIEWLSQLLFSRPAREEELAIARQLLAKSGQSEETETAWRELAHVLLCTNEFIYLD